MDGATGLESSAAPESHFIVVIVDVDGNCQVSAITVQSVELFFDVTVIEAIVNRMVVPCSRSWLSAVSSICKQHRARTNRLATIATLTGISLVDLTMPSKDSSHTATFSKALQSRVNIT